MSKGHADRRISDTDVRRALDTAQERFRQGRMDEAANILEACLSRTPNEPDVLTALAIVESKRNGLDRSISLLTRAVELAPDSRPMLCWLSFFLLQNEQPEEARTYAERAVRHTPPSASARATFAQCLYRLGQLDDAITQFYAALELEPNNPLVLAELGEALLRQRLWPQALDVLQKGVLVSPDPDRLLTLAALELRLGRLEQAESHCRRALKKGIGSGEGESLFARILTERSNLDEAEEHWNRALSLGLPPDGLNLVRAASLGAIGRFDEALEILERSAQADKLNGDLCRALAFARRMGPDDRPLIHRMESALLEKGRAPSDRLCLLYALGKANDDLGDYERAIGYIDQANELRIETDNIPPFDEAELEAFVDASIAFYTRARFRARPEVRPSSMSPILVVGMMRSGTTLAEQMLTCHPRIGGAGEQSYWADHDAIVVDYARGTLDPARLDACAKGYVDLLRSVAPDFPLVVDKNPANLQFLGSFHLAFPDAKIVQMRRDARDTALSIWMTPTNTTAPFVCRRNSIVFAYKQCMRLMDHWGQVLPEDRLLQVRYEELVSEPQNLGRRMVEHCGIEWEEACLHPERNERRVTTPSVWQVRQPIYRSSAERWKKYEPWLGDFAELQGLS